MWVKTKKNKQWIPVFHCYNRSTTVWKRRDRENPTNHKRGDREAGAGAEQDKRAAPRDSRRVSRDAPGTAARTQRSQAAHGGDAPHHTLPQPRIFRRDGWDSRPRKAGAKKGEKRRLAQMSSQGDSTGRLLWLGGSRGDSRSGWYHELFQTQSLNRSIWSQLSKK